MKNTGGAPRETPIRLRRYVWGLTGFWTLAVAFVLTWEILDELDQAFQEARSEATGIWEKEDAVYRWAVTRHGVYLPVTQRTRPDPNLEAVRERDVATPAGTSLTMVSPPTVMRQIFAARSEPSMLASRVTSLQPVDPRNGPDAWETEALRALAAGQPEYCSTETVVGQHRLRLMRPLITESACLTCHAEQGHKVGEIRGGLSVTVSIGPIWGGQLPDIVHRIVGYGGMWLLGLGGIAFMSRHLQRQIRRRAETEAKLREAHDLLEGRVAQRTAELADANHSLQSEIIERSQAEQWLLESEQRFRGYFEQGLVGMAILSAERQWVEVNQRLCRMLGYAEEELLLKTWSELTHPDDRAGEEPQFRRLLEGAASGFVLDKRFLRKNGAVLHAGLSAQCMRKADGMIDCLLILVQEMSGPTPL